MAHPLLNMNLPGVTEIVAQGPKVPWCVFCGCDDLRLGGRHTGSYVAVDGSAEEAGG